MSRFRKLSDALWNCQYHIVWVPKYRFRILTGAVGAEVGRCIRTFCAQLKCEIVELNIPHDHIHLLIMIPPKVSVSEFVGTVKGRTAIRFSISCQHFKQKPTGVIIFWAKGYCVDTVGLDEEKVRKYVKYQQDKEYQAEQRQKTLF